MVATDSVSDLRLVADWRRSRKSKLTKQLREALGRVVKDADATRSLFQDHQSDHDRNAKADQALEEYLAGVCLRKPRAGEGFLVLLLDLIDLRAGQDAAAIVRQALLVARRKVTEKDFWATIVSSGGVDKLNGHPLIPFLLYSKPDLFHRLSASCDPKQRDQRDQLRALAAILSTIPKKRLNRKAGLRSSLILVESALAQFEQEDNLIEANTKLQKDIARTRTERDQLEAELGKAKSQLSDRLQESERLTSEVEARSSQISTERNSFETTNRYEKNRVRGEIRKWVEEMVLPNLEDLETAVKSYEAKDETATRLTLAISQKLSRAVRKLLEQLKDE